MTDALVLLVDDDPLTLKLLRDVLHHHGHRTAEARSGGEALRIAAREGPGLILLDVGLPDADGATVLARLRSHPATSTVPVVAVTASAMAGERERLLAAGFDDYVAKPVAVRDLLDRIGRLGGRAA